MRERASVEGKGMGGWEVSAPEVEPDRLSLVDLRNTLMSTTFADDIAAAKAALEQ